MPVHYRLVAPHPDTHRLQVTATFPGGATTLIFPSWAPGSYLMREFARNARNFSAATPDGRPVTLERVSRNTWRVAEPGPFVVRYEVYCHEKSVRTPYLDAELAFFLPSNVLLYDPDRRTEAHTIEIDVPAGQVGVCALGAEVVGPARARWDAPDVDAMMDAPISIAAFQHTTFDVDGVPHHHWIEPGHNGDLGKMNEDLRRVVAAAQATVGGPLPYPRYDFVTLLANKGHGGLEHKGCSVLLRPRLSLKDPKEYEEFITLAAHEHFHAWNVKRIHPDTLGPTFDYDREHYTRDLWWLEGGTVYYEERVTWRAGLVDRKRHLERLAEHHTRLLDVQGRHHQPLEESSFDAWVKLYRPGEDSTNSTVSYYLKGAVVIWAMDLELLHLTGGRAGVDAILRTLWERWGRHGRGYPEGGTLRTVAEELLVDLPEADRVGFGRWWDEHIVGTAPVRLAEALDHAGYDLVPGPVKPGGWLGLKLDGRLLVEQVRADGPAAGILSPGDELVALDDVRLGNGALADRLRDAPPGTPLRVLLARDGRMMERTVTTAATPPSEWTITPRATVDPARATVRAAWIGADAVPAPATSDAAPTTTPTPTAS